MSNTITVPLTLWVARPEIDRLYAERAGRTAQGHKLVEYY